MISFLTIVDYVFIYYIARKNERFQHCVHIVKHAILILHMKQCLNKDVHLIQYKCTHSLAHRIQPCRLALFIDHNICFILCLQHVYYFTYFTMPHTSYVYNI